MRTDIRVDGGHFSFLKLNDEAVVAKLLNTLYNVGLLDKRGYAHAMNSLVWRDR